VDRQDFGSLEGLEAACAALRGKTVFREEAVRGGKSVCVRLAFTVKK
jgi:hypothetical protein